MLADGPFLLDAAVLVLPLSFLLSSEAGGASEAEAAFNANARDLMCSLRRAWILAMMRVMVVVDCKEPFFRV